MKLNFQGSPEKAESKNLSATVMGKRTAVALSRVAKRMP
jgi:hypothetical protein